MSAMPCGSLGDGQPDANTASWTAPGLHELLVYTLTLFHTPFTHFVSCSFTLEASFAGASRGRLGGLHFSTAHLEDMGAGLVAALSDYWDPAMYGE